MEADFRRFYGLDVRLLWVRRLTFRQVFNYVKQLPNDSALRREISGPIAQWSQTDHLLAGVIDEVRVLAWILKQVNSEDRIDFPDLVPRPGDVKSKDEDEIDEDDLDEDEIIQRRQEAAYEKMGSAEDQAASLNAMLMGLAGG